MSHSNINHRRTHNLLLISKLLSQRDHASPFTLVLDNLERTAKPLIREYLRRAKLARTHSIFLSFETFIEPAQVDTFLQCCDKTPAQISQAVTLAASTAGSGKRCLILIDSLTALAALSTKATSNLNLTAYLSSLLQPPRQSPQTQIALVAVYHTDVPLEDSAPSYQPPPVSLLSYLATTIITVHSLPILLAEKAAHEKSQATPIFGLMEEVEGIVVGLKSRANSLKPEQRGVVIELEHRRKSGRGVLEWYFLPSLSKQQKSVTPQAFKETVTLLDDHPLFRKATDGSSDQELTGMTFDLGLTDRQRQEREGVVLPYFDAQKGDGPGEGGRILYDMSVEDDFDEEEDEI